MAKTRTPPPLQPQGWEKSCHHIDISCTESELLLWRAVFGDGKVSDTMRNLVNLEAYRRAGVKMKDLPAEYKFQQYPILEAAVRRELQRHKRRMIALAKRTLPAI